MEAIKAINLGLAFVLELALLAALGVWALWCCRTVGGGSCWL